MFSILKRVFGHEKTQRDKLKAIFGRYVDEEVVDALFAGKKLDFGPQQRTIAIVLVEFNTTATVDQLLSGVADCIDLAIDRAGGVDSIVSHLIVVSFGCFKSSPIEAHVRFVADALAKFGANIRIAYAVGDCQVGDVGSSRRKTHSFVHPNFPRLLHTLATTTYGQASKV